MRGLGFAMQQEVRPLAGLAVPIVIGFAASMLISITDSIMLAPLGPVPLAAVGLTGAVSNIVFAGVWGLLTALGVRIGTAWGAGEGRRIPHILRNGLILGAMAGLAGSLAMGAIWVVLPLLGQPAEVIEAMPVYWTLIALFMLPYAILTVFKSAFEAVDRAWLGTGFAFLAVLINIPLNYWMIWGGAGVPPLGLTGAGVASLVAEIIAMGAAWVYWLKAPSMRRLRLRRPVDWREVASAGREGAPLGLLYTVEAMAMTAATVMIGTFGTVALAANQVIWSVAGVLYMVPLGIAGAVAIRVAQENGAGNMGALRPITWTAQALALVWLGLAAVIMGFGGRAIAGAITPDEAVVALAAQMFLVIALTQIFDGVQSIMLGSLRGMSDTAWPANVSVVAYWLIALPAGWIIAHHMGLGAVGVWLGFALGTALAGLALTLRFLSQTRGEAEAVRLGLQPV